MPPSAPPNFQGLTIVMTTNRYATLMRDEFKATREALFRPGRVDMRASFAKPDEAQMRAAVQFIFSDGDGDDAPAAAHAAHATTAADGAAATSAATTATPPESLTESEDKLIAAWPMASGRSKSSFASLKGHLMRFAHRTAAAACDAEAVREYQARVRAGRVDAACTRATAALRSIRAARAGLALAKSQKQPGKEPRERLRAKLEAAATVRLLLARLIEGVESGSALAKDGADKAQGLVAKLQKEADQGMKVEEPPTGEAVPGAPPAPPMPFGGRGPFGW